MISAIFTYDSSLSFLRTGFAIMGGSPVSPSILVVSAVIFGAFFPTHLILPHPIVSTLASLNRSRSAGGRSVSSGSSRSIGESVLVSSAAASSSAVSSRAASSPEASSTSPSLPVSSATAVSTAVATAVATVVATPIAIATVTAAFATAVLVDFRCCRAIAFCLFSSIWSLVSFVTGMLCLFSNVALACSLLVSLRCFWCEASCCASVWTLASSSLSTSPGLRCSSR